MDITGIIGLDGEACFFCVVIKYSKLRIVKS